MRKLEWKWLKLSLLASLLALSTLGLQSCTEEDDDDDSGSFVPEYVNTTTGGNGTAALTLENYTVNITVMNEQSQPVQGAAVDVFQGEDVALVWIELAGYYPIFQVINLGSQSTYTFNLTLIQSGGYFQVYNSDPPNITALFGDGAVTAHCFQGTMEDLLGAGVTTLGNFWAIRIYGQAAALGGGGVVNLGLFANGLNSVIFQELMFSAASIMSGDIVQFCFYSISVGGTVYYLPYVQIGNVIQQASDYDYKFILTWGANPSDLDSHLFTPEIGGSTHHVYYANRGSAEGPPYAWLDVDDVSSWGPEATTIEQLYPGTYTFAVYEYSGSGTLATSEAHVEVFNGRTRVGGYDVPTTADGDHWWWTVGTVDGATGVFTPVNTLLPNMPANAPVLRHQDMPIK
ncbi:MAG: hypothetical protein Q8O14_01545 [bacterium]|jgi:hypothetical protein|nr:hypothetical protein [bacterium]